MKHIIIDPSFMNGHAIWSIHSRKEILEISVSGGIVKVTDPDEVKLITNWMRQAKGWAKNPDEVYSYVEYMLEEGQFDNTYDEYCAC